MADRDKSSKTLLFPPTLSGSEREIWERSAHTQGYRTEATRRIARRFPQEPKEPDYIYWKRIEAIRRHEAAVEDGRATRETSQNARTHGFSAHVFRLSADESPEEYARRVEDALRRYQPQDSEELDQVAIIVNTTWLLSRLQCVAADLLCQGLEAGTRTSDSFCHCQDQFASLSRYEGTLNRTLDKARKRLKEIRQDAQSGLFTPLDKNYKTEYPPVPDPPEAEKRNYKTELPVDEPEFVPLSLDDFPPSTPLEDVIEAFERNEQPFSMRALVNHGHWYEDARKISLTPNPYDTDVTNHPAKLKTGRMT